MVAPRRTGRSEVHLSCPRAVWVATGADGVLVVRGAGTRGRSVRPSPFLSQLLPHASGRRGLMHKYVEGITSAREEAPCVQIMRIRRQRTTARAQCRVRVAERSSSVRSKPPPELPPLEQSRQRVRQHPHRRVNGDARKEAPRTTCEWCPTPTWTAGAVPSKWPSPRQADVGTSIWGIYGIAVGRSST